MPRPDPARRLGVGPSRRCSPLWSKVRWSAAALRVGAIGLLVLALGGCVTERRPVVQRRFVEPPKEPGTSRQLPSVPVIEPAPSSHTLNTRVAVTVLPLGSIEYDGQVLPLVSPDGKFVATEVGTAPTWPMLLAQGDAVEPVTSRVRIHRIGEESIELDRSVDEPVLLGRSCDSGGFLIESPRENGARWIGYVRWQPEPGKDEIQWLVHDEHVNSHASLGPAGELAFCRRFVGETTTELIVRSASASRDRQGDGPREFVRRLAGISQWMPTFAASPDRVFVFEASERSLTLACLASHETDDRLVLISSLVVAPRGSALLAYQCVAPLQTPVVGGDPSQPFLFFHPARGAMVSWDPQLGDLRVLCDRSVAAAPVSDGLGHLVTTTEGVLFCPRAPEAIQTEHENKGARVLSDVGLVRPITGAASQFVLLSPAETGQPRVGLMKLWLGTP